MDSEELSKIKAPLASRQQRRWNLMSEAQRELCEKILDMQGGEAPLSTMEMAEVIGMVQVWWCSVRDEGS